MRMTNRFVTLVAIVTLFIAAFAVPAIAGAESQFVSKINASRAAAGKAPLEVYWDLSDDARSHSAAMAAAGKIFHNPGLAGVTSGWLGLAENVGGGLSVDALHLGFMASPGHRANILGDFNYIGVGVTVDAEGRMWVTTIFMKGQPGLNGGGTTTTTAPPPTTTTTPPPPPTTTTIATPSPVSDQVPEPPASDPGNKAAIPTRTSASSSHAQPGLATSALSSHEPITYGRPFGPYAL